MENTEQRQRSYYAIIPAKVRYCKQLPILARMLYGELTALANEKGYCWASNAYFAELYEVSKDRISRLISMLEASGFISTKIIKDPKTKVILQRQIYIVDNIDSIVVKEIPHSIKNGHKPQDKKNMGGIVENNNRVLLKTPIPIVENTKENNTEFNNTNLNSVSSSFTNVQELETSKSKSQTVSPNKNQSFGQKQYSAVLDAYYKNCTDLFFSGKIKTEHPVVPAYISRTLKKCFSLYGFEKVLEAVRESKNHEWLVERGYPLSFILGQNEIVNLINKTYSRNPQAKASASPVPLDDKYDMSDMLE